MMKQAGACWDQIMEWFGQLAIDHPGMRVNTWYAMWIARQSDSSTTSG
jgi:hypothetical protein